MIFYFLEGILLVLAIFVVFRMSRSRYDLYTTPQKVGAFVGIMIGGTAVVFVALGLSANHTQGETRRDNLVALATDENRDGVFLLGTGSTTEKQSFDYLSRDDSGAISLHRVDAKDARVFEDEQVNPYLSVISSYTNEWWYAPFPMRGVETIMEFHIPPGAVSHTFEVKP